MSHQQPIQVTAEPGPQSFTLCSALHRSGAAISCANGEKVMFEASLGK